MQEQKEFTKEELNEAMIGALRNVAAGVVFAGYVIYQIYEYLQ